MPRVRVRERRVWPWLFAGFKWDFPIRLRGPPGLSPTNLETTSFCASLFGYAWFLVACVRFKKFTKFCEKFEKDLNEI
jgi:hypothetical protein